MILMNDFKAEPEELRREELCAVQRVLQSGWYILGREVTDFETAWAKFCGVKHGVGVGNGMDALEIGLRALDIGPGDEVITTPMTAMATVLSIIRAGATPVLADISAETALLDPMGAERHITSRTKAILLVHLYGQVRDMERWTDLCKSRRIHLLEDCAQSHGAAWNGQHGGTFGTWGAYSFYPTKNLGARGDGGALVTNSDEIAARAKILRNYGQDKRYHHTERGLNSRLDEMQAAILSARLKWLDRFNARRVEIAKVYFSNLKNPRIQFLAKPSQPRSHVYHLFVIRSAERDRLAKSLKESGIETLVHYPTPAHQQPCCACQSSGSFPVAEQHAQECLSIPCSPQMSDTDVEHVVKAINDFR